jgi:hypothetical protein
LEDVNEHVALVDHRYDVRPEVFFLLKVIEKLHYIFVELNCKKMEIVWAQPDSSAYVVEKEFLENFVDMPFLDKTKILVVRPFYWYAAELSCIHLLVYTAESLISVHLKNCIPINPNFNLDNRLPDELCLARVHWTVSDHVKKDILFRNDSNYIRQILVNRYEMSNSVFSHFNNRRVE